MKPTVRRRTPAKAVNAPTPRPGVLPGPGELSFLAIVLALFVFMVVGWRLGLPFIGDDYVFLDKTLAASNPLAAVEAAVLAHARGAFPPFPEAARAQSIFLEEVQLVVLGRKTVKAGVADITTRVKPLLPA